MKIGKLPVESRRIFVLPIMLLMMLPLFSQERRLEYTVNLGNSLIGSLIVTQNNIANTTTIKLYSDVKGGFILKFAVKDVEESSFQHGVLIHSAIYREVNGDAKVNKTHRSFRNGYVIETNGKSDTLCCKTIQYNLMNMYTTEPVNISTVYSDNFQKFLNIKTIGDHKYRIDLPDGNYLVFHYKNGTCIKEEVHHTFYTIVMLLK